MDIKTKIYAAFQHRDRQALEDALRPLQGADVFFDPLAPDTPEPSEAGSIIGLCASAQWHDGLRVCRDAGMNPNRNSMVRDPLIWAFVNDDVTTLLLLDNDMDTMPTRLTPDDRHFGIMGRPCRPLSVDDVAKCVGDWYGELDQICLAQLLGSNKNIDMRPVFGRMALNNARPNSHRFYDLLTQRTSVQDDEACRYFAQFAYFDARNRRRDDIMSVLVNNLGLEPDESLVRPRVLSREDFEIVEGLPAPTIWMGSVGVGGLSS